MMGDCKGIKLSPFDIAMFISSRQGNKLDKGVNNEHPGPLGFETLPCETFNPSPPLRGWWRRLVLRGRGLCVKFSHPLSCGPMNRVWDAWLNGAAATSN